jgi:hypothetical protein
MTPCDVLGDYERFENAYCLHLQGMTYQTTRFNNPEHHNIIFRRRENAAFRVSLGLLVLRTNDGTES